MNKRNKSTTGALPFQHIKMMIANNEIINTGWKNIQPASIDLSISDECYRMKGTFLPRKSERIRDIIRSESLYKMSLDNPIEKNGVYLIRLNERLDLSPDKFAFSSSKSSAGRIDLQTRLIIDNHSRFDCIPAGYKGEMWLQIISKSFLIKLNSGDKLNQIRFFNGDAKLDSRQTVKAYRKYKILFNEKSKFISSKEKLINNGGNGLTMSINLDKNNNGIFGYKNLLVDRVLDFSKREYYKAEDFFEPIHSLKDDSLMLEKGSFYIFSTKELIRVPREFSAEMTAYDILSGEFRSHYAGFFDPGFGYGKNGEIKGRQAVLEVRSYDSNFIFRDGQPICQISFERLLEPSKFSYGEEKFGSHYTNQAGPKLSKHFKS